MASACTKIKQHIPCDLRPADRELGCEANSKAPLVACTRSVLADSFESNHALVVSSRFCLPQPVWRHGEFGRAPLTPAQRPFLVRAGCWTGRVHHGIYFNDGNTIGSGACDAGQDLLYLAAISPITRSHRSFPKLL